MANAMLNQLMVGVAKRMRLDFDQSAIASGHSGAKGLTREEIVLSFLEKYLPRSVISVGSSEVVDIEGGRSKQCDILVLDPSAPPLFIGEGTGHRVVPAECVYAVIEVKSKLTTNELRGACENILSVKRRVKKAFSPAPYLVHYKRYGKEYEYLPVTGIIFAFDSVSLTKLGDTLAEWRTEHTPEETPDGVFVLGEGALSWTHPQDINQFSHYCRSGSALRHLKPRDESDVLPILLSNLYLQLENASMLPLDIRGYMPGLIGDYPGLWTFYKGNVQFTDADRLIQFRLE
jgi:hypothetical protein